MVTEIIGKGMREKVKIESGMRAEIRTADGKVHSGTIRSIEEEPEVTPYTFSLEDILESRRWEAAVVAMQGLLTHKMILDSWTAENVANYSFMLADALVKKFKEGRDG